MPLRQYRGEPREVREGLPQMTLKEDLELIWKHSPNSPGKVMCMCMCVWHEGKDMKREKSKCSWQLPNLVLPENQRRA